MNIEKTVQGDETTLKPIGCLDTTATPDFALALEQVTGAKTLVIDFSELDFIASCGLRALVLAYKNAKTAGNAFILTGMNDVVREVFDITGLSKVITIRS